MFDGYLLSVLVWLPIIGGILTLLTGDKFATRPVALIVSIATFAISLLLWTGFNTTGYQLQFVELMPWIDTFKINFDGFCFFFFVFIRIFFRVFI